MIGRIFGKRQQDSSSERPQGVAGDRLAMLEIDYIGGRLAAASGSQSDDSQRKAAFSVMSDHMLSEAGLANPGDRPDFGNLPAHLQTQVAFLHTALLGDRRAADEALRSLGPVWGELAHRMNGRIDDSKTAANAATASEIDRVRDLIDLIEVLGGGQDRTFAARLLDWLKVQPPDPDLWHDIATGADPDGMDKVFEWIVLQPQCDASTAAFIFHIINSFELLAYRDESAAGMYGDRFRTAVCISRRWREGSFPSARFWFMSEGHEEPFETYRDLAAQAVAQFGLPPFDVQHGLFEFRQGERTRSKYFFNGQMTKAQYLQMLKKRRSAVS